MTPRRRRLAQILTLVLALGGCVVFEDGSYRYPSIRGCLPGNACRGPVIEVIQEDDPRWICSFDGNGRCGS